MTSLRLLLKSNDGFLPMLLAIIIGVGGFISVGVIMVNRGGGNLQKGKANLEQLADLEKAIRADAYLNRRLPCPAHGDGDGGAKSSCTGNENDGVIPWRDLGLTREAVTDPFGHLISYIVDPTLSSGNFCSGAAARPGSIRLNPTTSTSLFVVISHGPSGLGGWLPAGGQPAVPFSPLELENCTNSSATGGAPACNDPNADAVTQGPYQADRSEPNFFDDTIQAAKSSDYDALCLSVAGGSSGASSSGASSGGASSSAGGGMGNSSGKGN